MDWITENAKKSRRRMKDKYSMRGTNIYIHDQVPDDINLEFVFDYIIARIPTRLMDSIDVIYVGDFPDFKTREIDAYYDNGAIFVTNNQEDDHDMINDIVHEIGHGVEQRFNDFIYSDNYRYLDNPDPRGATVLSLLSAQDLTLTTEERKAMDGRLYVKNSSYSNSQPLSTALSNILQKYPTSVQADINLTLLDFDIIQNTIFLETKSNLLIDKIDYKDAEFTKPSTVNTLYSVNSSIGAETFSNRFYVEDTGKVYFARFQTIGANDCEASPRNYLTELIFVRGVDEIRDDWILAEDNLLIILPVNSEKIILSSM